ncbi:oxidoreductase [Neocallimastix lanati (nom. inval.)]|nr:oxidoreductase [Neocallimastix sp. JGI-2020a]
METRNFGNIKVSAIGLGCMGFTHAYGDGPSEEEGIRLVHYAFENGCNLFDTAEMYSYLKNEEFVGKALKGLPRDKIIISDKFWPTKIPGLEYIEEEKLSEEGIRKCLEGSLKRLQTDYIDIYILHAMDEEHLEEVARVMGLLIKEGKIRCWGLSSPTAEQLKKAHAITSVSVVQSEYSMMERKWEKDVIPLCQELGIGFEAFAPMGNGFLSGKYTSKDNFANNDLRTVITRFKKENMDANQPLLDLIEKYSQEKKCTKAQIALAWILKKGDFIVPIPGMRKEERIKENLGAANVKLTDEEYAALNKELNNIQIYGDRNNRDIAKLATVPDNAH